MSDKYKSDKNNSIEQEKRKKTTKISSPKESRKTSGREAELRRMTKMADKNIQNGKMDNPEQYKTEKESLFDKYESEKNVDPIPVEDLKQEKERRKKRLKNKEQFFYRGKVQS